MRRRRRQPPGHPDVRAALAAAGRNHDLDPAGQAAAEQAWEEYWSATRPVELTRAVEQQAGQLAARHALRGADAVHLASALAVRQPGLILAAWDRRLRAGAHAAGLAITPPTPAPDSRGAATAPTASDRAAHSTRPEQQAFRAFRTRHVRLVQAAHGA